MNYESLMIGGALLALLAFALAVVLFFRLKIPKTFRYLRFAKNGYSLKFSVRLRVVGAADRVRKAEGGETDHGQYKNGRQEGDSRSFAGPSVSSALQRG